MVPEVAGLISPAGRVGIVKPSRGVLSPRFNVAGETIASLEGATANIGMQGRFDSYCKELFHLIQIAPHPSIYNLHLSGASGAPGLRALLP